jgi:hypothetical protein
VIVQPIFSPEDQDLSALVWYVSGNDVYAKRSLSWAGPKQYAHRLVLSRKIDRELRKGELADHINGNPKDCRRENLRVTNARGNTEHITKPRPFRGSTLHKRTGKWQAQTQRKGTKGYLGLYATQAEAANVAAAKRKELGFLEGTKPEPIGDCAYCQEHEGDPMMPPHTPSPYCESGKQPHCTCSACF